MLRNVRLYVLDFGEPGQRLQIILLDTRSYVTPWLESGVEGQFKKNWNPRSTVLGAAQWRWLEAELRKEAEFRVIVSPLQVAANTWPGARWGLFPLERQRLFDTIRDAKAQKVLIVSGNRGFGAIGKVDLVKGYGPLYDLTVGPFNGQTAVREDDFHYVGDAAAAPNFGLLEWDWSRKTLKIQLRGESGRVFEEIQL